ncbi:hypothetical protein L484_010299 [Morus notabilis]|uniref:Uncharacterized protein n=1 Tax=Morus notabilis TaxID=981085 RepID=W9QY40_9ROSA|nr:hypothetical protein L484_010299 [Morus notabilis]
MRGRNSSRGKELRAKHACVREHLAEAGWRAPERRDPCGRRKETCLTRAWKVLTRRGSSARQTHVCEGTAGSHTSAVHQTATRGGNGEACAARLGSARLADDC